MPYSVKYFINRNIRNLFIVFAVLFIFTGCLTPLVLPVITNLFFPPFALDYQKAFIKENLSDLGGDGITSSLRQPRNEIEAELNRRYLEWRKKREILFAAEDAFNYTHTYKQDGKYKFRIKPVAAYESGLYYTMSFFMKTGVLESPRSKPVATHKYLILDAGDALVLAKVAPDRTIEPGETYTGSFLPLRKALVDDLVGRLGGKTGLDDVFIYELDTMANFSSDEIIDLSLYILPLALMLVTGVFLIRYKADFRKHPAFKRLARAFSVPDEAAASIDEELSAAAKVIRRKNGYTTEHWSISRGFFITRFAMIKKKPGPQSSDRQTR